MEPSRRRTRELFAPTEADGTRVAIDGVAAIRTTQGVELRADGQIMRLTTEQAWAIASALLELNRLTR